MVASSCWRVYMTVGVVEIDHNLSVKRRIVKRGVLPVFYCLFRLNEFTCDWYFSTSEEKDSSVVAKVAGSKFVITLLENKNVDTFYSICYAFGYCNYYRSALTAY